MHNFFNRVGRFFMKLLTICLVLLISYQVIVKTDPANPVFEKLNDSIQNFIGQENELNNIAVFKDKSRGVITIDLMQDYSLPEVWVLKNGQRTVNFDRGIVVLEVENGDFISIDARDYEGVLWFKITSVSDNIRNLPEGILFRISWDLLDIGIIDISSKL